MAVAVDVGDHAAGRPAGIAIAGQSGSLGRVVKRAVAVVEVQPVAADVGHMQVGPAVAVDITDGHTLPETGLGQSGRLGHVLETTPTHVAEQPVAVAGVAPIDRPTGALGQVHVGPTVAVEIEYRDAATCEFIHPPPATLGVVTVDVAEHQPRIGCVVAERGDGADDRIRFSDNRIDRPVGPRPLRKIQGQGRVGRVASQTLG